MSGAVECGVYVYISMLVIVIESTPSKLAAIAMH